MKRNPLTPFIILILTWSLLAGGSVQGMLVCIHECIHHETGAVHFHPGDFPQHGHHPCDPSRYETCEAHRDTTYRHIPLSLDAIRNLSGDADTPLNTPVLACGDAPIPPSHVTMPWSKGSSFPLLNDGAPAFRKTTVLII
ncbi:MAG: hypothetical protein K9N21_16610 [Deltaproteobacteria bacterium]|nr:hypothetical protein [Deltaproteobacteria bacterium]